MIIKMSKMLFLKPTKLSVKNVGISINSLTTIQTDIETISNIWKGILTKKVLEIFAAVLK
jgi:hypothetical protein